MTMTINGTSGLVFNDASTQSTAATGFGFKNRLINGSMQIDQRNAGASVTFNDSVFPVDRFRSNVSQSSKMNAQQNAGSVTPPTGFRNYLGMTSTSAYSVGSSDYFDLAQFIEGFNVADLMWGTASASPVTLGFWVRSSLTGTFGGSVANSATNRCYVFSYTISAANTWEYKSITIAGDTSGTWNTTNGQGILLFFGMGDGSAVSGTAGSWGSTFFRNVTGNTSVVGTNGATFYITGVQLEKGSTATSFDYRPYGTELALCQRYFYLAATGNSINIGNGYYHGSGQLRTAVFFPVQMRTAPSLSATSGSNYYQFDKAGGADLFNSLTIFMPSPYSSIVYNNSEASGSDGFAGNIATNNSLSFVGFSAEL